MMLWEDVGLDEIAISKDGRSVLIRLIDLTHGAEIGKLLCLDYFCYSIHNNFSGRDNGFACYVGEVRCDLLEGASLEEFAAQQGYAFKCKEGRYLESGSVGFSMHIESGEIVVDIGCRSILCPLGSMQQAHDWALSLIANGWDE